MYFPPGFDRRVRLRPAEDLRPVGPFPRPYRIRGPALVGAHRRGFAAREHAGRVLPPNEIAFAREEWNPYQGHTRCIGALFHGMTWGFQLAHAWHDGWTDASAALG
jgi:hypothetical protein